MSADTDSLTRWRQDHLHSHNGSSLIADLWDEDAPFLDDGVEPGQDKQRLRARHAARPTDVLRTPSLKRA